MNALNNVLLVEDNPADSDYIRELLADVYSGSLSVTDVPRLEEALRLAADGAYDVVLLDLGLPDSSGLDTLRRLVESVPDTPVVVITGNSDDAVGVASIQAGAQDFIVKGAVTDVYLSKVLGYACERHQLSRRLQEAEESYYQAQKMEALGQLAGGIAHDFNNLLTVILGYGELILGRPGSSVDDSVRREVEQMKKAAEQAASLTAKILSFSRRQTLMLQAVSLEEVLAGVEPLLRRTLGEDIDLEVRSNLLTGTVKVDVHQFEQVLLNLVVNARDAMPGGGRLTLETGRVVLSELYCESHEGTLPGEYAVLTVTDTGTGMDEMTKLRAFEPFYTTKPEGEGTGLGLASAYGTVRQSGGMITVESELGEGTCFRIYLPSLSEDAQGRSQQTESTGSLSESLGRETILVVEDEPTLRDLITVMLQSLGYRTLCAGDAAEATVVLESASHRIDVLLTDVVLPGGVRGIELGARLLEKVPELKIIYMSGYTWNAMADGDRMDEDICLLRKPFNSKELAAAVRSVLDGSCP